MKLKIYAVLACIIFLFSNCNDVLDRPSLTSAEDAAYWTSESRVRLYANAFYSNFFVGYGVGLCQIGAAVMGEQGYQYDAILLHYYTGATIDKLYD